MDMIEKAKREMTSYVLSGGTWKAQAAQAYASIAQAEQLKRLADNQDRQLDLVLSGAEIGRENNKAALEAIVAQAEQLRRIADALARGVNLEVITQD